MQRLLMSGFGNVCSSAFQGVVPEADVQGADEPDEEDELLNDDVLSPTNSSQCNSPILHSHAAPTNNPEIQSSFPTRENPTAPPIQPGTIGGTVMGSTNDGNDHEWETVETVVLYNDKHGSKEMIVTAADNTQDDWICTTVDDIISTDEKCLERCWVCVENIFLRLICSKRAFKTADGFRNMHNFFTKVDHVASRMFPLTFLIINIAYWASYIYIL